ncbi:hypothetical protein OF83DRAFT_1167014 [Amylostereum chailletii]|nr:hypothetical protein OF83DRAFT_1167014 [Amylostereum chailletii]
MAKRSGLTPSTTPFYPANDQATYRDLLLFEERLKTNALVLNRRKTRYQWLLAQLVIVIVFLLSEVLLHTNFLSIPYRILRHRRIDVDVHMHPYVAPGLLLVALTTLVLFFASGLYSEKIAYANRPSSYVPHANRSLRNLNMYLNVRKAPHNSYNPLSYLFPRPTSPTNSPPAPSPSRSPSPTRLGKRSPSAAPIPSIPPTTNPRGELIFSSRVDRGFRESYERYRAAFERKREERERDAAARTWTGWFALKMPWNRPPPPAPVTTPTHTRAPSTPVRTRVASGGTPSSSRKSTPAPQTPKPERGRSMTPSVDTTSSPSRAAGYM